MFCISSSEDLPNGDTLYHCTPINYDGAMTILIYNGWSEEQAQADLAKCPDEWILVNAHTQIS